jgi:hypothetical protein
MKITKAQILPWSIIEYYLKKFVPGRASAVDFNWVGLISGCNSFGLQPTFFQHRLSLVTKGSMHKNTLIYQIQPSSNPARLVSQNI